MPQALDLTGRQFGRLTVIESSPERCKHRRLQWICRCECGTVKTYASRNLVAGLTQSCGCLQKEAQKRTHETHGGTRTRLYRIWCAMKARCYNSNKDHYDRYGGRGITVCDEWRDNFEAFRDWATANGYRNDLTLDRIDNDGNYEPSNCRWATQQEQTNNSRKNVLITARGETHTIAEWGRITGVNPDTIQRRYTIEKKSPEESIAPIDT